MKSTPVRVTSAVTLKVTNRGDPDSKQLILGHEYDVDVTIYDENERKVHPSEVSGRGCVREV